MELDGAPHDFAARGNARAAIFLDDADRADFVERLSRVAERFDWLVWAYCLMDKRRLDSRLGS